MNSAKRLFYRVAGVYFKVVMPNHHVTQGIFIFRHEDRFATAAPGGDRQGTFFGSQHAVKKSVWGHTILSKERPHSDPRLQQLTQIAQFRRRLKTDPRLQLKPSSYWGFCGFWVRVSPESSPVWLPVQKLVSARILLARLSLLGAIFNYF